ncbi:MAG: copper chaperone PCu(A)C [Nevskiales bacterium]|nr:copper chaperone PCu(A)C [Nevskiales bacterium]
MRLFLPQSRLLLVPIVATLGLYACNRPPAAPLSVENPRIRLAPPGAMAMAGYATLHNNGSEALRCDSVSGPDFGRAEIHRSVVEDGVSRMLGGQILAIAAGGSAELKPGDYHIMLFEAARAFGAGDTTELTIDCGPQQVTAKFRVVEHP